jgi:hypothetical protein
MSLDLNKLENKLDEALSNETSETLTKFLNDKRMINNKQQTAVEWLIEQFWNNEGMLTSKKLEQAKEMEKKQIILSIAKNLPIEDGVLTAVQKAEQYYEQTYGGGEQ